MRKEKIILSVVAIATLLVTIIGATFAWFSVQTSGNVNASTEIETANLGTVTFANGNTAEAVGNDIYPGWSNEAITFSVTSANTTEPIGYTITATVTGNTTLGSALTYSMSCVSTGSGVCASAVNSAPTSTTTYTGTLATGNDTHTYTVNMSLPETGVNQNTLQNKSYKVVFSVALSNEATQYTASGSSRTVYPIDYILNGINYGQKTKTTIEPGEDITIGTERFKVATNNNGTIMAIPYYNLYIADAKAQGSLENITIVQATAANAGSSSENYGIGTAGTIDFATDAYWTKGDDAIDMSDSRNKVQPYIEAYQSTLEGLGATGITVRIGRYSELSATGITDAMRNPSGVGDYWLGSGYPSNATSVRVVSASGFLDNYGYNFRYYYGVRPVLIIN